MNGIIDIGYTGVLLSLVFVLLAGISSLALKLDLHRDILWGTVRAVAQLYLVGYVLRYIFGLDSPWPVLVMFSAMIYFASRIIARRIKDPGVAYLSTTVFSLFLTGLVVTATVTGIIVGVEPWYEASYFIPLGGMVVGNTMNAIAITLERLLGDLKKSRDEVEMYLSLGGNYQEASAGILRTAVGAGMIPSINSLMGVGLVSLPGMMTGQIIAGADPLVAVKYQIMVMLMLVAATAFGSILVAYLVRRRAFAPDHRLLL